MSDCSNSKLARARAEWAEKARWARKRQRQGRVAVTVYVDIDFRDDLVMAGLLTPEEVADARVVAQRLGDFIEANLLAGAYPGDGD